jgi:hypothetical protein
LPLAPEMVPVHPAVSMQPSAMLSALPAKTAMSAGEPRAPVSGRPLTEKPLIQGPPVEQGAIAGLRAWCQREVDEVLVEAHRGNQHVAVRHAEAVEQAVVDDDVALHAPNAGGVHLAGQFIDGGQRIFRRQARAVEGMGLVMVEVGVVQRAVRSRPATEGQEAGRHQDEIARQHAARDRTGNPVFRSGGRRRGCRARRPRRTACAPNR